MEFTIDLVLYRLVAVQKAAYRFSTSYQVQLLERSKQSVRVVLTPLGHPVGPLLSADQFLNEVLDQELREQVREQTQPLADLLLAQAFSGLPLTDPHGETSNMTDDPLAIRMRALPPTLRSDVDES